MANPGLKLGKFLLVLLLLIAGSVLYLLVRPVGNGSGGERAGAGACHALTRSHTGMGNDPVASPQGSEGCAAGSYRAGESIQLTAAPHSGWKVASWSGTASDASTASSSSVTMPAEPHWVAVRYGSGAATAPGPADFFTVAACRVTDTQKGAPLVSQRPRNLQIAGICDVPFTARAVAASLTVIEPAVNGSLAVWPANLPQPSTSVVSFQKGRTQVNNAIVPLATDGAGDVAAVITLEGGGTAHLTLDVTGYFR
jgi:hypothetical protein